MNKTVQIPPVPLPPKATDQESVYQHLRAAIMTGTLAPKTTLTIRGLAAVLNCSPTPIREAIRRLSSEHAIEVMGNRRMRIPAMTPTRFDEVVNLRIAVEIHAAIRALPYISEVIIEKIERIDALMDRAISKKKLFRLTRLNHEFHQTLYTANPHQTVMPIVESIWLQLGPFQRQVIEAGLEYYVVDRHKEIVSALKSRDPVALSIAIEADIRDGIYRSGKQFLLDSATQKRGDPSLPTKWN
ncbi:MAG: DNA-binding GntR family transcriptional regulator [Pseudorhodobacter sp.]|jgi:DNA-binding GntR family transcriptional regulator